MIRAVCRECVAERLKSGTAARQGTKAVAVESERRQAVLQTVLAVSAGQGDER